MNRSEHSILMNAFRPAKEIDDPEFFAGRASQVARLTNSLHVVGSCPIIYGDRGLGKTSLAVQMLYIATGDDELLASLGIGNRAFDEESRYIAFLVTCTDVTRTFNDLIQVLINVAENALASETPQNASTLAERTVSRKISLKAFETESVKRYKPKTSRQSYMRLSPVEELDQLIKIIAESYNHPILFIIDELDRMRNTRGLASFIKAASNEYVKFILVGVATDIRTLLRDHLSLERSLVPVLVPTMSDEELREIIEKVESYLREQGIGIAFDHSATRKIVEIASGYPWFVHVIGQSVLQLAADEGRNLVVEPDIQRVIRSIATNQFAEQFGETYQAIVRNSIQRETVLRAFAEWRSADVPTSDVYRVLKETLGVTNPSIYKGQLVHDQVIVTSQYNPAWIRFHNEMFKIYVRLSPSIYVDVDEKVRTATAKAWKK
jgi:AAA ATPase domain